MVATLETVYGKRTSAKSRNRTSFMQSSACWRNPLLRLMRVNQGYGLFPNAPLLHEASKMARRYICEIVNKLFGASNCGTSGLTLYSKGANGFPPYFSSHFSSSRTLIFPCQGFPSRPCPSPGKMSKLLGIPRAVRARSSK
jgi:hypothetical protein